MCNLFVVLFTLNSVLVCNSYIINGYNQPVATSYVTRQDIPDFGEMEKYGYSKKYGYNKMIVTTYLTPVPEEVAASYSTYIIHPIDNKRCGYATGDNQPIQDSYSKATEDSAKTANFLKTFPIVVEDSDNNNDEPESENINQYKSEKPVVPESNVDELDIINFLKNNKVIGKDESEDLYKKWFFKEEPNGRNMRDGDNKNQYVNSYGEWYIKEEPKDVNFVGNEYEGQFNEWLAKEEPKVPDASYWKNFKDQFDSFYDSKHKEFFGDDDHDDTDDNTDGDEDDDGGDDEDDDEDEEDDDDGEDDDDDDEEYDESDWHKKPYEYEYQNQDEEDKDKWNSNGLYRPKYSFNDYNYGYRSSRKW